MKITEKDKLEVVLRPNEWITFNQAAIDIIIKNQENIDPDKTVEYVLENHYDEVKEAVFEQEAENQKE